jgi:hypothetical protein
VTPSNTATPSVTPSTSCICNTPTITSITDAGGGNVNVYFTLPSCGDACYSTTIQKSTDNSTWSSDTSGCNSPRTVSLIAGGPTYFRINQAGKCGISAYSTSVYYEPPTPTPSVTPSNTATPSVTPTITSSVTPSITPSVTPSNTVTPSVTPSASVTPSVTPSITPSQSGASTKTVYWQASLGGCAGASYQVLKNGSSISSGGIDANGSFTVIAGDTIEISHTTGPKAVSVCQSATAAIGTTQGGGEYAFDSNIGQNASATATYTITSGTASTIYADAGAAI